MDALIYDSGGKTVDQLCEELKVQRPILLSTLMLMGMEDQIESVVRNDGKEERAYIQAVRHG